MGLCLRALNQWRFVYSERITTKVVYLEVCLNMERKGVDKLRWEGTRARDLNKFINTLELTSVLVPSNYLYKSFSCIIIVVS